MAGWNKTKLVAVVGPTAAGKSRLAVELARRFDGEIIGADSRQIYRYMDIGTAKPDFNERLLVPHHLIDIVDPDEPFSLAQYQETADQVIESVSLQGHLSFLVGGTGLYVRAVLEGWKTPGVPPDNQFRYNMIEKSRREGGAEALYRELAESDPAAAEKIDHRNVRRVIRALEVIRETGELFSESGTRQPPPFAAYTIGLTAERSLLYRVADKRVDRMIEAGLVEEVEKLVSMGYGFDLPSMSGIGYRQIGEYLRGEVSLETAVENIKTATHRFIRHQYAWFRLNDETIHWYDINSTGPDEIVDGLVSFLGE